MNNNHDPDWKTYEAITKYIYEKLGKKQGVTILGYGNTCTVTGSSGVKHQVDVLTSYSVGEKEYKTAIECKYVNKKINKDAIMKLSCVIVDAAIDQGIIVSKEGFTSDAMAFANHVRIKLVQLREYAENDVPDLTNEVHLFTFETQVMATIMRPVTIDITARGTEGKTFGLTESNRYNTFIESCGFRKRLFDLEKVFFNELHKTPLYRIIQRRILLENGILSISDESENISSVIFTGMLTRITNQQNSVFDLVDQIWLYMKDIFDNTIFLISKNGSISEYKPD